MLVTSQKSANVQWKDIGLTEPQPLQSTSAKVSLCRPQTLRQWKIHKWRTVREMSCTSHVGSAPPPMQQVQVRMRVYFTHWKQIRGICGDKLFATQRLAALLHQAASSADSMLFIALLNRALRLVEDSWEIPTVKQVEGKMLWSSIHACNMFLCLDPCPYHSWSELLEQSVYPNLVDHTCCQKTSFYLY